VIFFSLPRLIAGAHWLSDILVGGVSIALIALAFGLYTPLLNRVNKVLNKWASSFIKHD
jgi:membrane-associated phospholipid phosphatase